MVCHSIYRMQQMGLYNRAQACAGALHLAWLSWLSWKSRAGKTLSPLRKCQDCAA